MKSFTKLIFTIVLLITITPLQASKSAPDITALSPDEMTKWGNPKTLPIGAHDYVLHGSPDVTSHSNLHTLSRFN